MPGRVTLRRVTENWKLKLAALALAVLLWGVVSAEQVTVQWLPIPVEVDLNDPDFVRVSGPRPAEVNVRFAGPGRELWELAVNRPVLSLRVEDAGDGRRIYVIDPQMVRIPRELSVNAIDVRPGTVRLAFQRVATRDVPVRVVVAPGSQRRWVVADSLRASPARVRVSGPADLVARIDTLTTRPVELGDDSIASLRVELDTGGMEAVRLDVGSVTVGGRLESRVERTVPRVPVQAPPGYVAVPATAELRVEGGRSRVSALAPESVVLTAVADSLPPVVPASGVEVPLQARGVPAGVTARVTPGRVRLVPAAVAAALPLPDSGAVRPARRVAP